MPLENGCDQENDYDQESDCDQESGCDQENDSNRCVVYPTPRHGMAYYLTVC